MKVNGHQAPEDVAREVLANPIDLDAAEQRRMWGAQQSRPESEQREPSERALLLARVLLNRR